MKSTEATIPTRRRRGHLLWLAGGALGASLVWMALVGSEGAASSKRGKAEPARVETEPAKSNEVDDRVRRLEARVLGLQAKLNAVSATREDRNTEVEHRPDRDDEAPDGAAPKAKAELTEEQLVEQERTRTNEVYAALEKRFADEPVDEGGSNADETSLRERVAAIEGYELSKLECRYTMCRIELKAEPAAGAADVFRKLDLAEGGTIRRRDDGTFLIFAGRTGFPFRELNEPREADSAGG